MKTLCAILIETRPKQNLIQVINNHIKYLPEETELYIYHGRSNRFLKTIYPQAHLTEIQGEFGIPEYNRLLTSPEFWSQFLEYDFVLIFQTDSGLLREGIEYFMELGYGYVGAPIVHSPYALNGGLSLRDPKLMHEIWSKYQWGGINEDMEVSKILWDNYPDKIAPREVAASFSAETIFTLNTLGYHSPQSWLTKEQCQEIFSQYK